MTVQPTRNIRQDHEPDNEAVRSILLAAGVPDGVVHTVVEGLAKVRAICDDAIRSETAPAQKLAEKTARYHGKMIRPTLAILCGAAAGNGTHNQSTQTIAAVLELVHLATLVHDDVLDKATERRGGATINTMSGNETAVIFGDYVIATAYRLCATIGDQRYSIRVGQVARELCEGELLQLSHRGNAELDEATYRAIIDRKTGVLIAAACELGAATAGAKPEIAAGVYGAYGAAIGAAFQIQDDILDCEGDAGVVGKPVGQDAALGKATLPIIHCLAHTPARDRGAVAALVRGEAAFDDDAKEQLKNAMQAAGSIQYARERAAGLVETAKEALQGTTMNEGVRVAMRALADAVVRRGR